MEVRHDTSFFYKEIGGIQPNASAELKRKRAWKVAALISAAKRLGAHWRACKRIKTEGLKLSRKLEGSVAYRWFPPDIYGWPAKISLKDVGNFYKSGVPSRFMYYDKGEWKDFSVNATSAICEYFRAGKTSAELLVDGKSYLVNFVQMMQLNIQSGFLRSISWIDEHGKCFFPSKVFEGHGTQLLSKPLERLDLQHRVKFDIQFTGSHPVHCKDFDSRPEVGDVGHPTWRTLDCKDLDSSSEVCDVGHPTWSTAIGRFDSGHDGFLGGCSRVQQKLLGSTSSGETNSDISSHLSVGGQASLGAKDPPAVEHYCRDFALLGDKLVKLEPGDQEYAAVRNMFRAGLGMLVTYTTVVGIHRDSHSSAAGQARFQAFQKQEDFTRNARGDANVRYAWHGTSKHGVSGIVLHGFGQPKVPKNGAVYGIGVYLAPEDYSHVSAVYSDVDENGEQHMVLCRVIMGNMEQVQPGSEQFHPSSENYDTGVDDLGNPKRYIIWTTHMNTHILPEYIVSFKLSPQWHDVIAALRGKQTSGRGTPLARWPRAKSQSGAEEPLHSKVRDCLIASPSQMRKDSSTQVDSNQGSTKIAPRSPWMSFPMLFLVMKSKLSPQDMMALQQYYSEFKAGRMPREVLIRHVRTVAGDQILADAIRSMQVKVKSIQNSNRLESCANTGQQCTAPDQVY